MSTPSRPCPTPFVILAGGLLVLSACATPAPDASAVRAPARVEAPQPKAARPISRAKRPDPGCTQAKVDLPTERKEALFREFDAMLGPSAVVQPPALPHSSTADCRQAAR